ncbi:threonine/serine exporter family protein [Aquibacillus koreensis]|uniref:Threonine/serine exporter family protein n=1 Tax=Aquibacillus koreensis TaxID=279446 RepID=A0A9X3WPT8_9BACI|nr:threonine/serine exporter family protein [Aquibacillus koreensis]MCT2537737.1 threonine/serine exporter family protein [Aquibacillus koreensis]MDC3421229.1 threonine/serine exporter family protein [Aquibacillus koreensis]
MFFEQLITSFFAASGFGIIFSAPKRSLIQCGVVGMLGWIVYIILVDIEVDAVPATVAASVVVAVLSQLCAKWFKTPIIIFNVSGIIPLVPGGLAYDAMRNFVENNYDVALQLAAKALLISGAIALGLVFSEIINQVIRKAKWKKKTHA